ncbi:MAG TPA: hypothetical protein VI874_03815 [Candidatus Norongarragalinales archaeon]|nr:hypothetical protein [Candidatus Norongarragalinales archaeon]
MPQQKSQKPNCQITLVHATPNLKKCQTQASRLGANVTGLKVLIRKRIHAPLTEWLEKNKQRRTHELDSPFFSWLKCFLPEGIQRECYEAGNRIKNPKKMNFRSLGVLETQLRAGEISAEHATDHLLDSAAYYQKADESIRRQAVDPDRGIHAEIARRVKKRLQSFLAEEWIAHRKTNLRISLFRFFKTHLPGIVQETLSDEGYNSG